MSTIKPTTVPSKRLSETINGSAMAFKLNNIEGWDGADLSAADFGTIMYAVFRNSAGTLMEIMEIDPSTIADASITINKRGLKFTGDLTTEVSGNKLTWVRGDTIVELGSHVPQLFNSYMDLSNEQTITGLKHFPTPTASDHAATKGYVDALALGGSGTVDKMIEAGTAGETIAAGNLIYFSESDNEWMKVDADNLATLFNVKLGIAQGSGTNGNAISGGVLTRGLDTNQSGMTQGDIMYASNTAGGISSTVGTIPRVIGIARTATNLYFDPDFLRFPYVYAADSVGTDAYAVTLPEPFGAYFVGMRITFKAGTANTGAATLAVNGGAAKTIKKRVSSDLETGDILQNQIVEVVYDGTNFQLVNPHVVSLTSEVTGILPMANGGTGLNLSTVYSSGVTTFDLTTASGGTTVIAHGLGMTPKRLMISVTSDGPTNGEFAFTRGTYNGTSYACIFEYTNAAANSTAGNSTSFIVKVFSGASSKFQTCTVTLDSTNITLTWTKTSTPTGTANILWEAWAF